MTVLRGQDGAGHCDADRGAHFSGRVVDGGRYALFLGRNGVHDRRCRWRNTQADPSGGNQNRPDHVEVGRVGVKVLHAEQTRGDQEQAGRHHHPQADLGKKQVHRRTQRDDGDGQWP